MSPSNANELNLAPVSDSISPWMATPWWPTDTKTSKQYSLLQLLATATKERLAVAPLVQCMSEEHRFFFRRQLRLLGNRLAGGMPLADALEQIPGMLPDGPMLAIRLGHQSGVLAEMLSHLRRSPQHPTVSLTSQLVKIGGYGVFTFLALLMMLTFFLIKIIPSFQAIFDDFDLDLPPITYRLIGLSNLFASYWYVIGLTFIALCALYCARSVRNFLRRSLFPRLIPPVASLHTAELMDMLAAIVETGRPLAGALSTLARYHFDPRVRRKLLFVRNELEQGADLWQTMAQTRLITSQEANAIERATSSESRAWTLNRLAQQRYGHIAGKIEALRITLQIAAILFAGAIVLFVALACLVPLFHLIEGLL